MDPDEGGGTPPRRSRRIQALGPMPQSSPSLQNTHNDNQTSTGSVRVSEASLSQYDSAHNTHDPNSSLVVIPPNTSSNTITSSDPPEDHTGISYQTQSANPSISSSSTPYETNLPRSIDVNSSVHPPFFQPNNQTTTSLSTHTPSSSKYVPINEFNALKTTVDRLENNMDYFNTTLHDINAQNATLQQTLDNVNNNIQHQITNAVVKAMTTVNNMNKNPTTMPITSTITTDTTMPTTNPSTTYSSPKPITSSNTSMPTHTSTLHQTVPPTSPVNPSMHHTNTPAPITIADIIQMGSQTKCTFPTYTKNMNVYEWKELCILELAASNKPNHANLIQYDIDGNPNLNQNLSKQENQELFRLTRNALSSKLPTQFITVDMLRNADGIALWDLLIQRYKPIAKDDIQLVDMKAEFTSLQRFPKETDDAYIQRFEEKVCDMEFYGIKPSLQLQAVIFLGGLNEPLLSDPIMQLRESTSSTFNSWFVEGNMKHSMTRAKNYVDQKKKYSNISNQNHDQSPSVLHQTPPVTAIKPSPHTYTQPYKYQHQQRPTYQPPPAPFLQHSSHHQDNTSMYVNNIEALKTQFKSELVSATNKQDCIFNWRNKNKRSCALHPGQSHKFFQCRVVQSLCKECNLDHELHRAIHNSSESTRRLIAARENGQAPDHTSVPPPRDTNTSDFNSPRQQPTARRVQSDPQTPITYSEALLHPPSPPITYEYESGSNISHSTNNSTNNQIDPYSCSSHNSYCKSRPIFSSILNPPKSNKTVSFADSFPSTSTKTLHLKKPLNETHPQIAITDSGATDDLSSHKVLFEYIVPIQTPRWVTLGDDKTKLRVSGYGMLNYKIGKYRIRRMGYYVPDIGTTLISISRHMKYAGCYFHAENNEVILAYPDAIINVIPSPEFHVQITPAKESNDPYLFDESEAILTENCKRRKFKVIEKTKLAFMPPKSIPSTMSHEVRVKKLTPEAKLPARATNGSAGFDVNSSHQILIPANSQAKVSTGLAMAIPTGLYLRIASRSSLACQGINVIAGVIDNDYRGEIKVVLQNTTSNPYLIPKHSRIAQFLFERNAVPCLTLTNTLPSTVRESGGFGSSNSAVTKDMAFINRIKAKAAAYRIVSQKNAIKIHNPNADPHDQEDDIFMPTHIPVPKSQRKSLSSPSAALPPVLPEYSINKSLPKTARYSQDFLAHATGYYNNKNIIKYIKDTSLPNVTITKQDGPPISDEGYTATLRSKRRNTKPSTARLNYSDVWHMDIGFGPTSAIGGIRYCLMMVDKATRYRRMYPLKNLTSSIPRAINKFLAEVGTKPTLIRTDFDKKLLGSEARKLLESEKIRIEGAPPKRQHQNGLVERAWQSAVIMARNWLKSSLLPAKYWYFALKRAIEVSNISPIKLHNKITTPFEAVHDQKVDLCQLFPIFSTSYIKQETQHGKHKSKWTSQSLKVICVGSCPNSDGLLFYHPSTKTILSCADNYRFDMYLPAGPQFGETYDGRLSITTKSSLQNIHTAPSHQANDTVYFISSEKSYPATILSSPFNEDEDPYVIQLKKSGNIMHVMNTELSESNPDGPLQEKDCFNNLIPWCTHDKKITLCLPTFDHKPKQGHLHHSNADGEWYFIPGRKKTNTPIHLSQFQEKAISMYHNKRLFRGWVNTHQAQVARHVQITSNIIAHHIHARKISAKDLQVMDTPTSLLKHSKLHPKDKQIWDSSYKEEYEGLQNLETWEVITEEQYQYLKIHSNATLLPTMAISVIKKDGNGKPDRAKYRIVVLGNFDTYGWEKHECFAPVLAQHEMRLLINLAVEKGLIPKQGDVSQAFCQAFLPREEVTVCTPPAGCPITPKSAYWKLKKSLYGMRRSPRHWYELAHKILTSIGLNRSPNAPCMYSGTILPNHPPIYLGLYVDDFIFFSQSPAVERHFQQEFEKHVTKVTWNEEVDYFLGVKFDCVKHNNKEVTIQLSQTAFVESLLIQYHMNGDEINTVQTPYRSGYPIDKIPSEAYDESTQKQYTKTLQSLVGSLTWLSMSTRPDLSTITNMLAKYVSNPSKGHLDAGKRILRYIKGTLNKGLTFSTSNKHNLSAYLKFPITQPLIALTDANWGPQDQSVPKPSTTPASLDIFKSRSLSGYILWGTGPIHWQSKRQSLTARSTAEAEIIATDECVKFLLYLRNICDDLQLPHSYFHEPLKVYNDNSACIKWSRNMTTKGLRYIQIRENAVRESVQDKFIDLLHIEGKINIADLFTKEDKDSKHFISIRDILVQTISKIPHSVQPIKALRGVSNQIPSQVGGRPLRSLPSSHNLT